MLRLLAAFVALLAAGTAPVLADATPIAPGDLCRHYVNRSFAKSRVADVDFVTVIAEACASAEGALTDPSTPPAQRIAAAGFLDRLATARAAIARIDRERFGKRPSVLARPSPSIDMRTGLGLVTPSGEFLILRHAGVFAALDAWVESGASFDLATALP